MFVNNLAKRVLPPNPHLLSRHQYEHTRRAAPGEAGSAGTWDPPPGGMEDNWNPREALTEKESRTSTAARGEA